MGVGLKIEAEGNVEASDAEVHPPDRACAGGVVQEWIQDVVEIEIYVVVLERPARARGAFHVIRDRIVTVASNEAALKIEARDRGCRVGESLENFKPDRLPA